MFLPKPFLNLLSTWPFDNHALTMPSTPPRAAPGSNEELLVTQARLYRLLVEGTDRLQRQRGLPRTGVAEVARLNGFSDPSEPSDDASNDSERKGST